jgi:hypothetical protein
MVKPGHKSVTICNADALRSVCECHEPAAQDEPAEQSTV